MENNMDSEIKNNLQKEKNKINKKEDDSDR